jgi:hypothetical protein
MSQTDPAGQFAVVRQGFVELFGSNGASASGSDEHLGMSVLAKKAFNIMTLLD